MFNLLKIHPYHLSIRGAGISYRPLPQRIAILLQPIFVNTPLFCRLNQFHMALAESEIFSAIIHQCVSAQQIAKSDMHHITCDLTPPNFSTILIF